VSVRFLRPARAGLVALFFAVALASALDTYPSTWSFLRDQRVESARLSALERRQAAGYKHLLPVDVFDFFRTHLRPGDRYYVQARPGRFFAGVDRPTASRTFARFYLLPAVEVDDAKRADVVLSLARDPQELGLRYSSMVRAPSGRYFVARVAR
jgi:hypothetical protein